MYSAASVFISYSHEDEAWKARLLRHLRVLELEGRFSVWDDQQIEAGDEWLLKIEAALESAAVAVLLISADSLTSDFIRSVEVRRCLERRQADGVLVVPLILRPCAWDRVKWLAKLQCRPKDGKPLSGGDEHQIDSDLTALVQEIDDLLRKRSKAPPLRPSAPEDELLAPTIIDDLTIVFSPLAKSSIENLGASREHIVDLLREELAAHKILTRVDYENHPRPLRDGFYVIMTKRGRGIFVDQISKSILSSDIYGYWSELSSAYSKAYTLPFRKDHLVLIRESEFKKTFNVLQELLVRLSAFVHGTKIYSDEGMFIRLHKLKNDAVRALESAEIAYFRDAANSTGTSKLGEIAIGLDLTVSSVHKILLEYTVPR